MAEPEAVMLKGQTTPADPELELVIAVIRRGLLKATRYANSRKGSGVWPRRSRKQGGAYWRWSASVRKFAATTKEPSTHSESRR